MIYGPGPRIIAFVLNAQINSVKTPDMMQLWNYSSSAECPLCGHKKCTLHHILVNCKYALDQGRYTWRHDSVLANIEPNLTKFISEANQRTPIPRAEAARKDFHRSFIRKGEQAPKRQSQPKQGLFPAQMIGSCSSTLTTNR